VERTKKQMNLSVYWGIDNLESTQKDEERDGDSSSKRPSMSKNALAEGVRVKQNQNGKTKFLQGGEEKKDGG